MYSTCCSVESAGYCDLSFREGRVRCRLFFVDEGVEGARELLPEAPRCGTRGGAPVGTPLRTEGLEAILVDGNDDSEACR